MGDLSKLSWTVPQQAFHLAMPVNLCIQIRNPSLDRIECFIDSHHIAGLSTFPLTVYHSSPPLDHFV